MTRPRFAPFLLRSTFDSALSLGIILAALSGAPAPAQEQSDRLFVERLDVNVVNVEVYVIDKDGYPVLGLGQDDFEIFEDGEPVEITNLYTATWQEHLLGQPTDETSRDAPQSKQIPAEQRLSLVVYVDHSRMFPADRRRVLEALRDFLEDRLVDGGRIMLTSYDRRLKIVQPFTQDRFEIEDALESLRKPAALGSLVEAQRRQVMTSMALFAQTSSQSDDPAATEVAYRSAYQLVRSYVQQVQLEMQGKARALESMIRSMSGLPGRRALLYVGGGLPQRPGEELYRHLEDLFIGVSSPAELSPTTIDPGLEPLQTDQSKIYDRIARASNANQVTLYTLDASGSRGHSTLSADANQLVSGTGSSGRITMDAMRTHNLREPLITLAHNTGGSAVVGTFNFRDGLNQLAADFKSYYSLGYRSPAGGDGLYHKIEVRAKVPGLRLRHRSGYVDLPPDERVADRTLSALLMNLESNPLEVQVDILEPREHKKAGRAFLPVLVRIPFSRITLIPTGEKGEGSLHIFIVVKDADGGISDLHRHPYQVEISQEDLETIEGRELGYLATLEVERGEPTVAVGVWDELSGKESFVQKKTIVEIPGEEGG